MRKRSVVAMHCALIGIALVDVFLRHAVERGHDHFGLERQARQMRVDRDRQRLDVVGIVVIRRRHPQRRLRAHLAEHAEHLVADGRRRRGRILRIERHHQQPVAALRRQGVDPRGDRRIAVAHRPIDHDMVVVRDAGRELVGLRAGDGLERRFVLLGVPDLPVVARLAARAGAQDDAVQRQLPQQALVFDHAGIGQELLEIDAHAPRIRGVGGAEIDQQHADALRPDVRAAGSSALSGWESTAVMRRVASRVGPVLVKITGRFDTGLRAFDYLSMINGIATSRSPRVGGSHDRRRMVRFRKPDALSLDDRADQVDRVSPLRQCQTARSRLLRRPDCARARSARTRTASRRFRSSPSPCCWRNFAPGRNA